MTARSQEFPHSEVHSPAQSPVAGPCSRLLGDDPEFHFVAFEGSEADAEAVGLLQESGAVAGTVGQACIGGRGTRPMVAHELAGGMRPAEEEG